MTTSSTNGKAYFDEWADYQKKFFETGAKMTEEMLKVANGSEYLKPMADFYDKQMDWLKTMTKNQPSFTKMGFEPMFDLPSIADTLDDFKVYWDAILRSIQFGVWDKSVWSQWFSDEKLKDMTSQMLGVNLNKEMQPIVNDINKFFEALINDYRDNADYATKFWTEGLKDVKPSLMGPEMVMMMNHFFNDNVQRGMKPLAKLFPVKERDEIIEAFKNVQYSYLGFFTKFSQMQTLLVESGASVFPEVIKHFYGEFETTGKLPDYDAFFGKYIEITENKLIQTLNTSEYSKLQSSVANALVTSRKEMEKLKELLFEGMPFVKYGEFDDALLEISTLKRKMRKLATKLENLPKDNSDAQEARLAELEKKAADYEQLTAKYDTLSAQVASVLALVEAQKAELAALKAAPAAAAPTLFETTLAPKTKKVKKN
ncbi:MAG: hypothetical protein MUE30_05910 [Spirosomaceae bacterium]|nr:hypothetical protein [Spirosomataceae bacterium]